MAASESATGIEKAHQADLWRGKEAVAVELTIRFGGKERFRGRILMRPQVDVVRLERADGAVAVFDGTDAWLSPAKADWPKARFDVLTWAYFWAAPYKLQDRGARLESTGEANLRGTRMQTARLTFATSTGDAPNNWYVLYRDPDSSRLAAMAYIVAYGTAREEAEKEPHAIVYEDFQNVEGIPMSLRWMFWNWSKEKGITGEPLG